MWKGTLWFFWIVVSPAVGDLLWGHVEDVTQGAGENEWTMGEEIDRMWVGPRSEGQEQLIRHARSLVYPNGGVYKFIIGMGIPVPVPNKTLALGVNFQFQYGVPTNATQFYYPVVVSARNARHHRAALYKSVETALDRHGLPGKVCLLRAVCEAAETPLLHDGLLGELFHLLLTPSLGHAPPELLEEYRAAEEAGASGDDCSRMFSDCPGGAGLLDQITCLRHLPDHEEEEEEHGDWRTPPPHWDFLNLRQGRK